MREKGRTRGAKANTLHHTHRENIHMHIIPTSKPHRRMPSHACTPGETHSHTQSNTHTHTEEKIQIHTIHVFTHSHHKIPLDPAFSGSPLRCLRSYLYAELTLSSHHFLAVSLLPLSPQFAPPPLHHFPPSLTLSPS